MVSEYLRSTRCGAKILFVGLLIRHGIHRLVLHLDRHPHFGGFTELDELLVKVEPAVDPGSLERFVKIRFCVRNGQVLELAIV